MATTRTTIMTTLTDGAVRVVSPDREPLIQPTGGLTR